MLIIKDWQSCYLKLKKKIYSWKDTMETEKIRHKLKEAISDTCNHIQLISCTYEELPQFNKNWKR